VDRGEYSRCTLWRQAFGSSRSLLAKSVVSTPGLFRFTSFPDMKPIQHSRPTETPIAFAWDGRTGGKFSVYVQVVGETTPLRLTHGVSDRHPVWTPDGRYVTFSRAGSHDQEYDVLTVPRTGVRNRKITRLGTIAGAASLVVSPAGRLLAIADHTEGETESIFW